MPSVPRPTRMSNVDAAWLGMDEPENLMMITAVLCFDTRVDWDRLHTIVGPRLLERFPKFSQRPMPSRSPLEQPVWQDDPDFDVCHHIQRSVLDPGGDDAALAALVGRLMGHPLDMRHSPWQFHLIDGYGKGCAVVARVHHCIADGMALASVLLSLTDDRDGLAIEHSDGSSTVAPVPGRESPRPPGLPVRSALQALRFGMEVLRTVVRILLFSRDPRTRLRGQLGVRKGAAWTPPHRLDDIKAVARATSTTVNDVLLAATAGALRRHLIEHGERPHDLRAFVPVSLRPADAPIPRDLGNRFGLVFLRLPVSEPDAVARVLEVSHRMRAIKGSSEAAATFALLSAIGAMPTWARDLVIRILGSKSTAIITNVPGPRGLVYLAGSAVSSVMFWVPQAASLGLGISIFSYAGVVTVGIAADSGLVDAPHRLAESVDSELRELARRTAEKEETAASRGSRLGPRGQSL